MGESRRQTSPLIYSRTKLKTRGWTDEDSAARLGPGTETHYAGGRDRTVKAQSLKSDVARQSLLREQPGLTSDESNTRSGTYAGTDDSASLITI